jgi:hypothetical protein
VQKYLWRLEQEAGLNFLHLQVGSNHFRDMSDLNPAVSFVHSPAKLQHAAGAVGNQHIGGGIFNMIQFLA